MEAQRRIKMIASHFVPTDDLHLSPTHLLPMNCSSTLNSVIRRGDSKMYFARQGSAYQPNFMRQGSIEDVIETVNKNDNATLNSATRRLDSKVYFARQGSAYQASFMRQAVASSEEVLPAQSDTPLKSLKYSDSGNGGLYYISQERPLFSRPSSVELKIRSGETSLKARELFHTDIPPKFAVPSGILSHQKEQYSSRSNVIEWSPRTDIAESGRNYLITVEIPGVNIKDIRVEVDDKMLTVAGKGSAQHWKVAGSSNDSFSAFIRREIVQGPYEVVWPLPANVNKDNVSAEFLDGVLRVIIPKL
ncbi:Small heat shock protein HSP [Parasponia andersonii]|uniref:Small heat shock protein HSP n=1 Tax=Parasponia andersonii TaxID=3476 RepID=A0A2P5D7W3_PARAD|nr:Small heat shock protein HSP [Parasponia andersonii]